MKISLNSILSLHRESFGWIAPWMSRAPRWIKIRSPQSPLTATPPHCPQPSTIAAPFLFFSAAATAAVVVMVCFFLYSLPLMPPRGPCCRMTSAPRLQRPSRLQTGGLPLPPGGSATNDAMSIPTAPTCFRSKGGHRNHWKDRNIVAIAVIVIVAIITVIVAIVIVVAVAVAVTITVTSLQVAVIVAKTINL